MLRWVGSSAYLIVFICIFLSVACYIVTATINAIPCVTAFCIEMRTLPPRSSISPRNRIRHHPSRNCAHPNSPKFPEIREIPPPPGISPGGVKFPPPGGGGGVEIRGFRGPECQKSKGNRQNSLLTGVLARKSQKTDFFSGSSRSLLGGHRFCTVLAVKSTFSQNRCWKKHVFFGFFSKKS